jgi:hypothetical protein
VFELSLCIYSYPVIAVYLPPHFSSDHISQCGAPKVGTWMPTTNNRPHLSKYIPFIISMMCINVMVFLCAGILFLAGKYHLFHLHHVKHSLSGHSHRRQLYCHQNYSNVRVHPNSNMLYDIVFETSENNIAHLLMLVWEGSGGTRGSIGEFFPIWLNIAECNMMLTCKATTNNNVATRISFRFASSHQMNWWYIFSIT